MNAARRRSTFSKAKRLIRSSDFARVRSEGSTVRGQLLTLGVLPGNRSIQAGFVTAKRVGGAVLRNRLRRRLREIVRLHQSELCQGVWIVTIARPSAANATYAALSDEWLRLAKRASILAP